jgi:acetyltransferase-like isoleucine patch superfamily enzyme
MHEFAPSHYFECDQASPFFPLLCETKAVWEILPRIGEFIGDTIRPNVSGVRRKGALVTESVALVGSEPVFGIDWRLDGPGGKFVCLKDGEELAGAALILPGAFLADDCVEIGPGALVETGAMVKGPSVIGPGTEVRQTAYVRGQVMTGTGAVVGHSTEAKNTLMLDDAKAGHFAYLGDSVLGAGVNLGAGTKLANLKMIDAPFRFKAGGETVLVELRKFGAILGDGVETGCNSVTSPGVLMGQRSILLPNTTAKGGYYPPRSIIRK